MARHVLRDILSGAISESDPEGPLTNRRIWIFYYPLALTSMVGLAAHPMVTFFMGSARFPIESLAVLPVVNSVSFIFRSAGLSFQEVGIALLGMNPKNHPVVRTFALILGLSASGLMALFAFSPAAWFWYHTVSDLTWDLAHLALLPTMIIALMPMLSVLLSFQRAILVDMKRNKPIIVSTVIEVGGIIAVLMICIFRFDMIGVTAAAVAYIIGRLAGNAVLIGPCVRRTPIARL